MLAIQLFLKSFIQHFKTHGHYRHYKDLRFIMKADNFFLSCGTDFVHLHRQKFLQTSVARRIQCNESGEKTFFIEVQNVSMYTQRKKILLVAISLREFDSFLRSQFWKNRNLNCSKVAWKWQKSWATFFSKSHRIMWWSFQVVPMVVQTRYAH